MTEQLGRESPALKALAHDWRKLLFPEATDKQFADGFAQVVAFGLLMARAKDISLTNGLDQAAKKLGQSNSLIGAARQSSSTTRATRRRLKPHPVH